MKKFKIKGIQFNPVLVLFTVLVLCAIATWFVSPGAFDLGLSKILKLSNTVKLPG